VRAVYTGDPRAVALVCGGGSGRCSTYGPTADTGGLFQNQAEVIYRYDTIEQLLEAEAATGQSQRPLPGPGAKSPTERPG
jgi:hypothetical protein